LARRPAVGPYSPKCLEEVLSEVQLTRGGGCAAAVALPVQSENHNQAMAAARTICEPGNGKKLSPAPIMSEYQAELCRTHQ
jgi:hypothetical protein